MTEQEKMKQGYLWNDDDENIALQTRCKELVKQFNETPAGAFEKREALLHDIFGKVEANVKCTKVLKSRQNKILRRR